MTFYVLFDMRTIVKGCKVYDQTTIKLFAAISQMNIK